MTEFNEIAGSHFPKLDMFTVAITRAHGKNHPEAFKVRELFAAMNAKVEEKGSAQPDLTREFTELRKVTDNYDIPGDVCETYAAVYTMLSEADQAYNVK